MSKLKKYRMNMTKKSKCRMKLKIKHNAYEWFSNGVEGLYHEGEEVIAKDGEWACIYAVFHLKDRFRMAEEEIMKEEDNTLLRAYKNILAKKGIEI